jgi:AraC-like DNA-binding protein
MGKSDMPTTSVSQSNMMNWSTDDVAPQERFDYWRDSVCSAFDPMSPELQRNNRATFKGQITAWQLGQSALMEIKAGHHDTGRSRKDIAQGSRDYVFLYRQQAEAWFDFGYQPGFVSGVGSLVLGDADRIFTTGPTGARPFHHYVLKMPRDLLRPAMSNADDIATAVVSAPSGIGALLLAYFDAFVAEVPYLAPEDQATSLSALASLAAAAYGRRGRDHDPRQALQTAQLRLAKAFIARNATNPCLSPALVAGALGISLRRLHRFFEATGDTVSRHILHCRLEVVRLRLRSPEFSRVTILDLAFDCGFTSLATFYRAYRIVYGVTPAEYRNAATQLPPP